MFHSLLEAFSCLMHMDLHWSNLYQEHQCAESIYYPWVIYLLAYCSLFLICNYIHTIRVSFLDLVLYSWGSSYRKRRLVLYICYQILCRLNVMIVARKTPRWMKSGSWSEYLWWLRLWDSSTLRGSMTLLEGNARD